MPDIDFLSNKKSGENQKSEPKPDKKEKLVWSDPEKQKTASKGSVFSFLPFLDKKDKPAAATEKKTAIDKNKIKRSRQEILRLIKNRENSEAKDGKPTGKNLLSSLGDKLRKQPDQKEILVDYQKVFNQEKVKRSLPAEPTRKSSQVKPMLSESLETKFRAEEFKKSWLGELFKLINEKIKALFPAKSVKLSLPEIIKSKGPELKSEEIINYAPQPKKAEKILTGTETAAEPTSAPEAIPRVLETNLIKGEIITFFDWRRKIKIVAGAMLMPVLLISLIYLGLISYQKLSQADNKAKADKFNELINQVKSEEADMKEITEFQARLKKVSQIFSKHLYWTNFFKFLEDNTLKDVYYDGFAGDTSGKYSLGATANAFTNITEQTDIFSNNKKITKVKVNGGEAKEGGKNNQPEVEFLLNFSILKSIFTE